MSLKERREIVALAAGQGSGVLVTLVRAAGSSYRGLGARLLILPDGRTAGTISGGCLEADLLRKAAWKVREGAVIERYNTSFDDTAEIPYGLGCGGEVDLLLEPLNTPEAAAMLEALRATLLGEPRWMVTVLPGSFRNDGSSRDDETLRRIVMDGHGDVLFASEHVPTEDVVDLRRRALNASAAKNGNAREGLGRVSPPSEFVEILSPAQRLVIFGAGEDAKPLARLAAEMGWTVVVADGRPHQARAERFPEAHAIVATQSAVEVPVLAGDAVVLMTHSYEQDRRLLTELLSCPPRYLGLLGARHRSALLLSESSVASGVSLEEAVARTCAPIGVELGGDGPEAIALSIVAQIQAELNGRARQNSDGALEQRRMHFAEVERHLASGAAAPVRTEMCGLEDLADELVSASNLL